MKGSPPQKVNLPEKKSKALPEWIDILLICVITVLFIIGAIKTLTIPGIIPFDQSISNCYPAIILLGLFIVLKVFISHDLATFIVILSMVGSIVAFYFGIKEKDKDIRSGIFAFATGLLGFGAGLPVGKKLSQDDSA